MKSDSLKLGLQNAPHRALYHALGLTTEEIERPLVGIVTYGLYNAQERGRLFIGPGVKVYEGMIVGESARNEDLVINVCKKKHVTNIRASGSDEALRLTPPVIFSLEQSLEFIGDDELCEITPKNIRLRKKILNTELRAKNRSKSSN